MSSSILTASADAAARETRAEQVFHDLQRAIITGELAAGSKLSEPALASRYGISRGTLRAALHRLEGHRLVVREAHIGTRVVTLELSSLIELFQIRESLEGLACRLAAARMPASEVASLSRLLDQHAESTDFTAGRGYCHQEGDFDFHYRIVQASGNAALTQMLGDGLYQRLRIYRVQLAADAGRAPQAMIEHRRILEALAARDGELAEILMRRHIATSRHHIERRLSTQPSTEGASS